MTGGTLSIWLTSESAGAEGSPISLLARLSETRVEFFRRAFNRGCAPSSPSLGGGGGT